MTKNDKEDNSHVERMTQNKLNSRKLRKERDQSETNIQFYYIKKVGRISISKPIGYIQSLTSL